MCRRHGWSWAQRSSSVDVSVGSVDVAAVGRRTAVVVGRGVAVTSAITVTDVVCLAPYSFSADTVIRFGPSVHAERARRPTAVGAHRDHHVVDDDLRRGVGGAGDLDLADGHHQPVGRCDGELRRGVALGLDRLRRDGLETLPPLEVLRCGVVVDVDPVVDPTGLAGWHCQVPRDHRVALDHDVCEDRSRCRPSSR